MTWRALLAVLALAAGVLVVGATPSTAAPTQCTGTINNASLVQLVVPANSFCRINNTTITGWVQVNQGSNFETCNSKIGGWVYVTNAYILVDGLTTIGGGMDITPQATGTPGSVSGNPCTAEGASGYSGKVCPKSVGGPIAIHNAPTSSLPFALGDCAVIPNLAGSIQVNYNNVPVEIEGTLIGGSLVCNYNTPPVTQTNNTVKGRISGCGSSQQQPT
jgi:hypothetical protein